MIRVTFIITGLEEGGAEVMLYRLLGAIDQSRFEPIVISLMAKDTRIGSLIEQSGIMVHTLGIHHGQLSARAMLRLISLVRSLQPDIIQGYMYHGNLAASLTGLLANYKIPVLWNIHHVPYNLKDEKMGTALIIRMGKIFAHWVKRIIYVSRESSTRHESLGYPSKLTKVIPNGFDCAVFKPSSMARTELRGTLGVSENDILIGLIGRYHPMKDHANFINAAGILVKKYANVYFLLAGREVDEKNKEIDRLVQQNKLCDRVHLLGVRNDIPQINASLDISSSSSFSEAFPLVVGEAMACGVPCVVTDVGDSAWVVGDTGKVVPPRDAEALAEAWSFLIEQGPEERNRLGNKARQRILENFTLDKIVQEYEMLYESASV